MGCSSDVMAENDMKPKSGYRKVKWLFGKTIEIPEEWEVKQLSKLSKTKNDIIAGPFGSNLKVSDYKNDGIPIIRLQNIERNEFINKNIQFISKEKAEELAYHSYLPNDLVLAKLGDPIGKTCTIPKDFPSGIVVADVVRIRISKKHSQNFVEYVLNSEICTKQYNKEKIGTTRPRINLEQVRNIKFPTPPLPEQTRIAAILSGVDACIESTQKVIESTERLKRGLMQELLTRGIGHKKFRKVKWLFGKTIEIPKEWNCIILDELTPLNEKSSIRMGPFGSSLKKHELLDSGKIKTLWIENIVNNKFVWKYQKFITKEKYEQLEGFTVKPNDLLMTMMGTLGKTAIVPSDIGTAIISSHLLKITPEPKKLISKFLYYFVKSQFIQKQIIKESHGLVMNGLNTGIVKQLLINTPPINEQTRIASILSGVDAYIQKNQEYKKKLERLKKGLMQKLLTGKIRVSVDTNE